MEDAIAANGSVTHTEESKVPDNQISEGIVNATPEVKMSNNADSVPNQGLTKDGEHGTETNDKIVNTEGKTDSNENDQANSNEDKKVDGNLNSETNNLADVSNKSAEPSTKDAEDTANVKESPQDGVESVSQNYNYNADSDVASDEPGDLPERKTSITWADSYNDKQIESPDLDASDGPLPTETSESNTERVQDDSVPKSAIEQTQSESVIPQEDQASPPKTDDNLEERQSPEGSSNDSPRPPSPRDKKDSVKTIEEDQDNHPELDQKKDVEAVQQSQDQPAKDDEEETGDPKTDTVKPIDDDGLMRTIQANEVNTQSSSPVTSSEAIPNSSEESADREQKSEVQSSEDAPESSGDASEPSKDASESSKNAPESLEDAPEPSEDTPEPLEDASDSLTDKTGNNKPELNSEITKSTDQQLDSEQKQDNKDAQDNRHSDNDSPQESKTLSDVDHSKSELDNGHKESDSVESNIAVVKPMMRSSSQEEDKKNKKLENVQSVENSETSPQADRLSSNDEEYSPENQPDSKKDSEKAADEPESNVDTSKVQNGDELSKDEEIPVGQPPLATHLQTGNSKSEHKTETNLESEKPEPAKSDNDFIGSRDDNDDRSDNELDNNRENNNPSPGVINKKGDNEDVDEVKEHNVEVKDNSEDTENNEVTPCDNINEVTENNESKEGTSTDEVKEVKEVTQNNEVKEGTSTDKVTQNDDVIGNNEVAPQNDEVKEVKGEMIHDIDIRENTDQTHETIKASDEEKTESIAQTESPLEEAEKAQIQPETAQKLGSTVQDDKKDEDKDQPAHTEPPGVANDTSESPIESKSEETTEDQKSKGEVEDPQKKTSVSSQTIEEKGTTPEVEQVPEEVQKDDFSKWLLDEEVKKSEETSDQRGQDRTPTPVRKATPEPETEEISTAEEYKEPTSEEKKAEEMENNKRGNDDDKGEARAGTNQRGEDSQNKETNLPKETEEQKVEDKQGEQQDTKPPQSNKSQEDPPQTKRKTSVKQNVANIQKSIGRRRSVRAPKHIQSEKPKEEQQRPAQRSRPVEANKPAFRQRPITREKTAPPPNKGSTGSRPETTNGRMRKTSTSSNGRLLQRETTRTSQKSQRPKTTGVRESADGRAEQNEFFKKELTRIEEGLKKEVSKIQKPTQKKHTPFIFNDLKPYYDTSSQRYLIQTPEEQQHCYASRTMAIGLIDPWKNLEMDKSVLPVLESKPVNRGEAQKKKEKKIDERAKKTKHEGSTRLPKYPVVTLETSDLATKKLYYSDVPMLREELKQKYSANATKKVEEDYEKTKQDFYRMDLDKLNEVHPVNREHMRSTYFAYLQNTPGSKKAINECVKSIDKTEKAN